MNCDFNLTCGNCGSAEVLIKGTAIEYGSKIRVQFQCKSCKHTAEMYCVTVSINDMD